MERRRDNDNEGSGLRFYELRVAQKRLPSACAQDDELPITWYSWSCG